MSEVKPKNLYQKLVQVRRSVKYIQKNTQGYQFQYANEGSLLAAIRDEMDNQNVFLEMEMISLDACKCTTISDKKGLQEIEGLRAVFEFIWTDADNPADTIRKRLTVQHAESSIKTVGCLMTYANRYFLYKFFCVPTDKMDPDAFENNLDKIIDSNEHISPQTESSGEETEQDNKNKERTLEKINEEFLSILPKGISMILVDEFVKYIAKEHNCKEADVKRDAPKAKDVFISHLRKWLAQKTKDN